MAERKFACPHCRQPLRIAQSSSRFVICPECRRASQLEAGRALLMAGEPWPAPRNAALKVGEVVSVRNRGYRVTGLMQYRDADGNLSTDYDLDARGSREASLEQADGEWTLNNAFPRGQRAITLSGKQALLYKQPFPLIDHYRLEVVTALGEFEELPERGERVEYAYYEGEDYDLGAELSAQGEPLDWYLCYTLDADEAPGAVRAGSFAGSLQRFTGLSGAEKTAREKVQASTVGQIFLWSFIFIAAAIAIHVAFAATSQDKLVYESGPRTVGTDAQWVSEPFSIEGRTSNVLANIHTTVNNQWLALELTLVNTQTGKWYRRIEEISFYHGVDGGESWREGDANPDAWFGGVPAGEYQLEVAAFADQPQLSYNLRLRRDAVNASYLLIAIGVFLILPVLFIVRALNK
jgi:uncharacterized protein YbaR (Trm112 family)